MNSNCLMTKENFRRPTAIYKTKVSILLHLALYAAAIGLFGFTLFHIDLLWAQVLCGLVIVSILWPGLYILRYWNDRIVITPSHISISHLDKKTRDGEWTEVGKNIIEWGSIKDITSQFDVRLINLVRIQKEVIILLRNGVQYRIDSDLYDVILLEHKLRHYWKQYGRPATHTGSKKTDKQG